MIESAGAKTKKAHNIKSHHNVGGLPETLHLKLLEPLRELFKDEVRELGVALGLARELVYRHPFPGPGLGVRILGEVKKEYADLLRRADAIFIEELRAAGWYDKVAQAFAVFLPVRSVGVMGDGRTYEHVVALRAVVTTDFMTAIGQNFPTIYSAKYLTASSTKCAVSIVWSMIFRENRRLRLSGNNSPYFADFQQRSVGVGTDDIQPMLEEAHGYCLSRHAVPPAKQSAVPGFALFHFEF